MFVYWRPVSSRCGTCNFSFPSSTSWGGILYTAEEEEETPLWPSLTKTESFFFFLFAPREWQRTGLGSTYFSMVHLVALSCRSDPIVLLCNREDLIYIWVFKPLDCSSPKSMWFLWNIFSKGTHMLQCLCGKSLKKNKNPSGKLMTIMPVYSVPLSRSLCVRESVTRRRARRCVIGLFVVTVIDLQSHLCSKWLMQSCGGGGRGEGEGDNLFGAATVPAASSTRVWGHGHTTPPPLARPAPHHHGTAISNFWDCAAHATCLCLSAGVGTCVSSWFSHRVYCSSIPPPSLPQYTQTTSRWKEVAVFSNTVGGDRVFFNAPLWLLQAWPQIRSNEIISGDRARASCLLHPAPQHPASSPY